MAWIEFTDVVGFAGGFGYEIYGNKLKCLGFQGPFPDGTPVIGAAMWDGFPASLTHQTSRLIYRGSYLEGPKETRIANYVLKYGGPGVRMQHNGAAGSDYDATCSCYCAEYQEDRDFNSPYARVAGYLSITWHTPDGITNFNGKAWMGSGYSASHNQSAFSFANIGQTGLLDGDEVKLTAMNYHPTPTTTTICLRIYLNGLMIFEVLVSDPAYQLLTGRPGITEGTTNGTMYGFGADFDDWKGCQAAPIFNNSANDEEHQPPNSAEFNSAETHSAAEPCPGVDGTIILPFGDFETFANDTAAASTVTPCQVPFDPADYPGITGVRFKGQFVKWDPDDPGTPTQTAGPDFKIVDETGTVYLDSSVGDPALSFVPNPDEPFYLVADVDVVFPYDPDNPHTYYIKETNDALNPTDSNEWQGFNCALYVSVVASDQVKLDAVMLPMFSFQKFGVALNYANTSTYAVLFDASVQQATYRKVLNAQSEIEYREGYFIADPFTVAGYGALFKVGGSMVPGTEIVIAAGDSVNAVPYSVQFSDDVAGFEAGDQYVWKFKNTGGSGHVNILSNGIRTKIGNAEGDLCAVNYETQAKAFVVDCELVYQQRAFKYVASEWTNGELFYFEATWHNAQTVNLVDSGTDGSPNVPPTVVSGSPLTFPSGAAFTTMRSGAITLVDGHWYTITIGAATTPATDVTASIIIVRPA